MTSSPRRSLGPSAVAASLVCLAAGCFGSSEGPPVPVYPVTGTVTLGGTPLEGATVAFLGSGQTRPAFGRTDADGVYRLTTFSPNDGAVEGQYEVTVTKIVDMDPAEEQGRDMESEDYDPTAIATDEGPDLDELNMVPPKYSQKATSGLSAKVTPDGENTFDFEL